MTTELQWTTTKPTKPGFYWVHRRSGKGGQKTEIRAVEVRLRSDVGRSNYLRKAGKPSLYVYAANYPQPLEYYRALLWAGPIEPPPAPTTKNVKQEFNGTDEVLLYTVAYKYDVTDLVLTDEDKERLATHANETADQQIRNGCREGELLVHLDPEHRTPVRGWWNIVWK